MRRSFALIILCAVNVWGFAQTTMVYGYDSNGNVVSRTLVTPVKSQNKMGMPYMPAGDDVGKDVTINKDAGSNVFTVNVKESGGGEVSVRIYDITSKLIKAEVFTGSAHAVDLNVFPDGIYIFEIKFGDKEYTQKIIKG